MSFDVALIHRVAGEIEASAHRLQQYVNAPNELSMELQKIQSSLNSLQSLTRNGAAGAGAQTAQHVNDQNQT